MRQIVRMKTKAIVRNGIVLLKERALFHMVGAIYDCERHLYSKLHSRKFNFDEKELISILYYKI